MLEGSIRVLSLNERWELLGNAYLELFFIGMWIIRDELRVDYVGVALLIGCVQNLEDLLPKKLVVPVNDHEDLVIIAVFVNPIVDVLQRSAMLMRTDKNISSWIGFSPFEINCSEVCSFIGGSIVNDNNAIIRIVLGDDRLETPDVPIVLFVHEGGHDDADGQLLILVDPIFLIVVSILLLSNALELALFIFEDIASHYPMQPKGFHKLIICYTFVVLPHVP